MESNGQNTALKLHWDIIIRWGLISALASVVLFLIITMSGLKTVGTGGIIQFILGVALTLYILFMAFKMIRDDRQGGYLNLGQSVVNGTLIVIFSSLVMFVFMQIYMNYIDPGYMESIQRESMELMTKIAGENEEAMEKMEEEMAKQKDKMGFSVMNIASNLLTSGIFGAIMSLIMGAVMRKDPNQNIA
ncbi:MAG: DUF4199 domain-containing protein [Saprospiraceae bacterium]|nr:DUF4199 domain-containing protein [Saprospiraceae bacterium]